MDGSLVRAFLPGPPEIADSESHRALRRRSAWFSTLIGGLELAKQGDVVLGQGEFRGDPYCLGVTRPDMRAVDLWHIRRLPVLDCQHRTPGRISSPSSNKWRGQIGTDRVHISFHYGQPF